MSNGREFYANNGIIGLAPGSVCVSEGYDGTVAAESEGRPCWAWGAGGST